MSITDTRETAKQNSPITKAQAYAAAVQWSARAAQLRRESDDALRWLDLDEHHNIQVKIETAERHAKAWRGIQRKAIQ